MVERLRAVRRALVVSALTVAGCAAPCKKVTTHHAEFEARTATAGAPHLSLAVPLATVDRIIAAEVRRLPALKQRLPSIAGVSLGTVGLRVERVSTRPAAPGRLGFTIRVGLARGKQRLLGVDIDAVVKPVIDPKRRRVVAELRGTNIQSLRPALGKGSAAAIADAVWRELPPAARAFTSKKQIEKLTRGVGDDIMRQAFALVKRELLHDIGQITRIELELPELPLSRVLLTSTPRDLILAGWTSLPVARGLPSAERTAGSRGDAPQLRLSGAAATELGNHAMAIGEIPRRWKLDGSPDPDGPLHAALGWGEGSKPLQIHLWQLEDQCAHVRLDARPGVAVKGRHLELRAEDARVAAVDGALKVRAGIWFGGLGRRSFSFVERTAARVSFRVGREVMTASVQQATLDATGLTLGLGLTSRG